MDPSPEQVRRAAYFRWEGRGHGHGRHDEDWIAVEQSLLLALNYEVVARVGPGLPPPDSPARLGQVGRRVCRFCEMAEPRTRFAAPAPALPTCLGLESPAALDQCDDCRGHFAEALDPALADFLAPIVGGDPIPPAVPIAAYKALVRAALSIAPAVELELFPDALEWIANPDHDHDGASFAGSGLHLHAGPGLPEAPWAALARKRDDDADGLPSLLFFAGGPGWAVELAVPLGARDEDCEGAFTIPRVACPVEPFATHGPARPRFLPLAAAPARRRLAALSWAD